MTQELTDKQIEVVRGFLAEGAKIERLRTLDLINSFESDTINKDELTKLINGEQA